MEIHQLRYVATVAQTQNFCRAAELCHVAQPSLSQQIKKLEEELGRRIFQRSRQGTKLTRFGRQLLPKVQGVLSSLMELENLAQTHEDGVVRGDLFLGAIPTIAPYFTPQLVQACSRVYPNLHLHLVEDTTESLVDKLLTGEIDCALMSRPHPQEQLLETVTLFHDPLLVSLSRQHPLAKRKRLKLPELAESPMIIMQEMHCLSGQSRALCETSQAKPKVSIQSAQIETMISLVESGMGYSLIPLMAAQSMQHREVVFRKVVSDHAYREIILAWPRTVLPGPLLKALFEVLNDIGNSFS